MLGAMLSSTVTPVQICEACDRCICPAASRPIAVVAADVLVAVGFAFVRESTELDLLSSSACSPEVALTRTVLVVID